MITVIKGSTGGERLKCLDIMGIESQPEGISNFKCHKAGAYLSCRNNKL